MKKHLLLFLISSLISANILAQNNLSLNIHHMLGESAFEMNTQAVNNLNNKFNITRLEYYISEISIIHDGGIETNIEDVRLLVNTNNEEVSTYNLGSYNISNIEKIYWHIGVDSAHNHTDPSSYPSSDPLSPKSPSMHWGWSAGYRFIAIEGNAGSELNQLFQLHGLGDNNYFQTEIPYETSSKDNEIKLDIWADYTKLLENIALDNGVIVHGENDEAKLALENLRDFVFSQSKVLNINSVKDNNNFFNIFPNPSNDLTVTIDFEGKTGKRIIEIRDIRGKKVSSSIALESNQNLITVPSKGLYFICLINNGKYIGHQKLIVE